MLKPASARCSMRCKYCFYSDVTSARQVPDFGLMSRETAEAVIRKALLFADGESVCFAFQGGEPLTAGKEFFRFFTERVSALNTKKSKIYYGMQTNGLLLDDEWAEFLHDNGFLVGLSLDGDIEDNRLRVDAAGKGTCGRVKEKAELLQHYEVDFNILTVLTGYCADNIERIYRFFRKSGLRYLQFIPCLRPMEGVHSAEINGEKAEGGMYMTPRQYGDFLIKLFNLYVKDYVRGNYTSIRLFDNWVRLYLGQQPEQCGILGHCSHQFVVEGNGNVYPCDFYCTDNWLLGNISDSDFDTLAHSEKATAFLKESLEIPKKCKSCRYYPLCRAGGCKRSRQDADYCEAYKKFFSSCLPLFRVFINE